MKRILLKYLIRPMKIFEVAKRAIIVLVLFCCVLTVAFAEEKEDDTSVKLPAGVPQLPDPREEQKELYVTKDNLPKFKQIMLLPLARMVSAGEAYLSVVSRLGFTWRLDDLWNQQSIKNPQVFALNADKGIQLNGSPQNFAGYPFGFADQVNGEQDPQLRAYKILWNMALVLNARNDILYNIDLSWVGARALERVSYGYYYSYNANYPKLSESELSSTKPFNAEDLLSQDMLKLLSPAVVFGFAAISERYYGPRDDHYWLYSPVIERSRRIAASNRGDELLGQLLTFDDFNVFNNKVQFVDARVVDEKVMLGAFPSTKMYRLQSEPFAKLNLHEQGDSDVPAARTTGEVDSAGEVMEQVLTARGQHKRLDDTNSAVLWNYETRRFPQSAAWLPTSASFVPRKVWVVEIDPKDPYYESGRQILIVDQQTFLPLYKLVYSQTGTLQRYVIGGWGLASTEDGTVRFPFLGFAAVIKADGQLAATISTRWVRSFQGKNTAAAQEIRKLLDISAHEKKQPATTSQR